QQIGANSLTITTLLLLATLTIIHWGVLPRIQQILWLSNPSRPFLRWDSVLINYVSAIKVQSVLFLFVIIIVLIPIVFAQDRLLAGGLITTLFFIICFIALT